MSEQPDPEIVVLISSAYEAFNRRDIDRVLQALCEDVEWANGWEGGVVTGHDQVRAYWTRQWTELDPIVTPAAMALDPDCSVAVTVDQEIRQPGGELVQVGTVVHRYTFRDGLVASMTIEEPSA